jgi:hypothetical protein
VVYNGPEIELSPHRPDNPRLRPGSSRGDPIDHVSIDTEHRDGRVVAEVRQQVADRLLGSPELVRVGIDGQPERSADP